MSVEELRIDVIAGDAIRANAVIRDFPLPGETQGDLVDVDSNSITLLDPEGNAEGTPYTTPVHVDTGKYYQNMTLPADATPGEWKVEWTATLSGLTTTRRVAFKVIA